MTMCEKYDTYEETLKREFSGVELSALASFCIIADNFKEKKPEAQSEWAWFSVADNEATMVTKIRNRFDELTR